MIDLKQLRENPDQFLARLNLPSDYSEPIQQILALDQQQRSIEVNRSHRLKTPRSKERID